MKVAAGRQFYEHFGAASQAIVHDIGWSLLNENGSWSDSVLDCDLIVYAADAYQSAFVESVIKIPAPVWAHTEDAGTDGLFYDVMRRKGVRVTHSPGANAFEVAEMAFSSVLWSAKNLGELRDQQRARHWQKLPLESLSDKTILVIGLGAIGSRVAALSKAFGMRVFGLRRSSETIANVDLQGTLADLRVFLAEADFIVLALPISPETQGLIDSEALAQMKPSATLVNIGRGALIDIPALKESLKSGHLRHVCLDVLPTEPWPADDDLWDFPNVLITPHNASVSPLYIQRVGELWLENLRHFIAGEPMRHRAF